MPRLALPLAALAALGCASTPQADLVLENGTVYTVDDQMSKAEAVAVADGKILFVGSTADAARFHGADTRVIDLQGAFVYPGWTDSHYHLAGVGEREMTLNLEGTTTKAAFLARVKERVDRAQPGEWIVGGGWIETFWTPPVFPTRQDLDAIAPDNPVVLTRADGHALIANTKALAAARITRTTPAPFGGAINKDGRGELTGMLIDAAQRLMASSLPAPTDVEQDSALVIGARRSTELGWTQVQDAGTDWATVARMRRLYGADRIKLRVYEALLGPGAAADSLLGVGPSLDEFDGRYTLRTIKVVMDGALGSRGAALLEPYSDDPGNRGLITTDTAQLKTMMVAALERGIQVETHAIGDRANHLLLNLYEWAFQQVLPADRAIAEPRWRDEHTQIVAVADLPRFKQLDIIPSMQPSHAIGDLYFAPSRLGPARLAGAYAWKTFLDLGLPVPGGSDAPVERGEPMIEFYAAVTRRDLKGNAGPDSLWHPEQKVSREQALRMFTNYPAFAAFQENVRGSIAVGKWADFTVLDRDLLSVPDAAILDTKPVLTVIGGQVVYQAPGRK